MSSRKSINGVTAVAAAVAEAMTTANVLGKNLVTQVCNVAKKSYGGKPIGDDDLKAIQDKVAETMAWSKASVAVRKSEVGAILSHYSILPETVDAYMKKNDGRCTWHNAVRLARMLRNEKGSKAKALKAMANTGGDGPANGPAAKKSAAIRVKGIIALPHLPSKFKTELAKLCIDHGINV